MIIAHLIYRFDVGGLERVMVNCINAMQNDQCQHIVIALTEVGDFSKHLNSSVKVFQLNKKSGKDLAIHWRLFKLLRQVKPQILHTYNLATIEYHLVARLAGVKKHIHAEHGRDVNDPEGLNKKHNLLRTLLSPFIHYFVPVSTDLAQWLESVVSIPPKKIVLIRNGINTHNFYREDSNNNRINFIHVARLDLVKDQAGLISSFAQLIKKNSLNTNEVHLTIVGDGAEMPKLTKLSQQLNIDQYIEFMGVKSNIAHLLANADVFVLSSIAEGIPMTVLEAMASSLPVISTSVGGIPELITDNENGFLVEKQNIEQLSTAMENYLNNPNLIKQHGEKARNYIENNFSETNMINEYLNLYNKLLGQY